MTWKLSYSEAETHLGPGPESRRVPRSTKNAANKSSVGKAEDTEADWSFLKAAYKSQPCSTLRQSAQVRLGKNTL